MDTLLSIVVIALAFEAGAVTAWIIADRIFVRPMRAERDKAMKKERRALEMAQLFMSMHAAATKEKRDAKRNGLIMSPIQVQFPGERND